VTTTSRHYLTLLINRMRGLLELKAALIIWMWTNFRLSGRIRCSCGYFNVMSGCPPQRRLNEARAFGCNVTRRVLPSSRSSFGVVNLRRQLQPGDLAHALHTHTASMTGPSQGPIKSGSGSPTDEELYAWTMRREAVASCLIEDILHLRRNPAKSESPGLALAISVTNPL
jgi:hypothetical protein